MGLVDKLKEAGYKPEASAEGEFKARKGIYKVKVTALRPEIDKKNDNAKYYQLETEVLEAVRGDQPGGLGFRKRYYVEDVEKGPKKLEELLNTLFTWGVELDTASDSALEASFSKAIGAEGHLRAWGWTPDGGDRELEMWKPMKAEVAEKKREKSDIPF